MRRQRAKHAPVPEVASYRGRRLPGAMTAAAAVLVFVGLVLILVRPLGMRFSGFLLLGMTALLVLEQLLNQWARWSRRGWWCRLGFRAAVALVLIPLILIEGVVIAEGRQEPSGQEPDAVIVLGAGVNGTQPSLSLQTRLDAALVYLKAYPEIPVVLTGGQGYGEEITEAQCMYDYLTERGVDARRLILEENATNTAENFGFSEELLRQAGIDPVMDTVAVVTNDFHIARARLLAARKGYGFTVGVPAELPWLHLEVNYYLREAFAVVKSALFD